LQAAFSFDDICGVDTSDQGILHIFRPFNYKTKIAHTMKQGWVLIFSYPELYQAKIAEDILKQHGIESHIANKPDSAIPSLGEAELYTLPEKAEEAMRVLEENDLLLEEEEE
jgi:hypothetical protein